MPLALRSSCLPRRERVRGLRDKREVGTILDFGRHARAFYLTFDREGCSAQIQRGNFLK